MIEASFVKLPLYECDWTSLISQQWFRWWLSVVRQQAITWANVDPDLWHHMVSLGHYELKPSDSFHSNQQYQNVDATLCTDILIRRINIERYWGTLMNKGWYWNKASVKGWYGRSVRRIVQLKLYAHNGCWEVEQLSSWHFFNIDISNNIAQQI